MDKLVSALCLTTVYADVHLPWSFLDKFISAIRKFYQYFDRFVVLG